MTLSLVIFVSLVRAVLLAVYQTPELAAHCTELGSEENTVVFKHSRVSVAKPPLHIALNLALTLLPHRRGHSALRQGMTPLHEVSALSLGRVGSSPEGRRRCRNVSSLRLGGCHLPCRGQGLPRGRSRRRLEKPAVERCCGGEVRGWRLWWVGGTRNIPAPQRGGEGRAPPGRGTGSSPVRGGRGLGGCRWGAGRATGLRAAPAEGRVGGHGSFELSWRWERACALWAFVSAAARQLPCTHFNILCCGVLPPLCLHLTTPPCFSSQIPPRTPLLCTQANQQSGPQGPLHSPAARLYGRFMWDLGEAQDIWVRMEVLVHSAASFKPHVPR